MAFDDARISEIVVAANQIDWDADDVSVLDFAVRALSLGPLDVEHLDELEICASLTRNATELLETGLSLPQYKVVDLSSGPVIRGLGRHLRLNLTGDDLDVVDKLRHHARIRRHLLHISDGHRLEAIGAAIMDALFSDAAATRNSDDQGVDVLAKHRLPALSGFDFIDTPPPTTADRVHLIASCKATTSYTSDDSLVTISPAHIRELVGGFALHRTSASLWASGRNIAPLAPIQLVLVTTYRLSSKSWSLAENLGVQVWTIPELAWLIAKTAPDATFTDAGFHPTEFEKWVDVFDSQDHRVNP